MKKILFSILCLILFLLPLEAFSATFQDVPASDSNSAAIEFAVENNIIDTKNTTFAPDTNVVQSDLLVWTLRSLGYEPTDKEKKAKSLCTDITDKEILPYFNKAIDLGALKISPKNPRCSAKKTVSKVSALRTVFFLYGIPTPRFSETQLSYIDVDSSAWFFPFVEKNAELNFLKPESATYFRPHRKITRADAANLLYRAVTYIENQNGTIIAPQTPETSNTSTNTPKIDILLDVYNRLTSDYYFKKTENFTNEDLIYNAISGLAKTAKDPYTEFQRPLDGENLEEALSGKIEGIGAHLLEKNNDILIVSLIKDSPAEKVGLRAKDKILKVNNESIADITLDTVIEKIKGKKGTQVSLTIYRESSGQTLTFTMTREEIDISFISAEIWSDGIADIELSLFGETTDKDFEKLIDELKKEGMKGMIIDLRNDPGGYLNTVISILEHFIPRGKPITGVSYPNNTITMTLSGGSGELAVYPVAVLINEGSASAAEIMAIALQEYDLATIIGTQSFGKGTVQELNMYDDGSTFKMTVAEWLSPKQNSIEDRGVTPDITVKISDSDVANGLDPQFDRAMQEMEKFIQ
ncbi:PDZ domain-containing protein [Candidatus Peregrinibacteria bacterium]|nr:PDZ domain-containing protein [Candidatus Peregrinibacteria bacterium]